MKTIFGTDGIRCAVGSNILTLEDLPRLGLAIGSWAIKKYGGTARILIAHDTRASCSFIKAALKTGLLLYPIEIHDAGILSTPAAALIARESYSCAIIISASHNPFHDNGIKIIDAREGKLSCADEYEISSLLTSSSCAPSYRSFGSEKHYHDAAQLYQQKILSLFPTRFLTGIHLVIDCANGATSNTAQALFEAAGAQVTAIHNNPNGFNINENCGSVHPESLQIAVQKNNATMGFSFDGDGDRVVAINGTGHIKNGDDILAVLAMHTAYQHESIVVGTVMSNQGLERHLAAQGKKLLRAAVGDRHVNEMLVHNNSLLGGEQSGHIILRDLAHTGDGILVALRLMETLMNTNNLEFSSFTHYPQVIINVPYAIKKELTGTSLEELIASAEAQINNGRLLVRYSGTEKYARVMVEAESKEIAEGIGFSLAQQLKKELNP